MLSKMCPVIVKKGRGGMNEAMREVELHIKKLRYSVIVTFCLASVSLILLLLVNTDSAGLSVTVASTTAVSAVLAVLSVL